MMMKFDKTERFCGNTIHVICPFPAKNKNLRIITKVWKSTGEGFVESTQSIFSPRVDHMTPEEAVELAQALIVAAYTVRMEAA